MAASFTPSLLPAGGAGEAPVSSRKSGRIDEAGFLKNLDRMGFTPCKALLEASANCLDAGATKITLESSRDSVLIIDNGCGMTEDELDSMAAMKKEHGGKKRRGVSGIGKSSFVQLTNKKPMKVLSRKSDGDHVCAVYPWDEMFAKGLYSGLVDIRKMTPEERALFDAKCSEGHGTILVLPQNDRLRETIWRNASLSRKLDTPLLDRIGIVFGTDLVQITIQEDFERGNDVIELYNYFGLTNTEYVCGKDETIISFYQHDVTGEYRFIAELEEPMEIAPHGKGFSKEPTKVRKSLDDYTRQGEFTHVVGLRRESLESAKVDVSGVGKCSYSDAIALYQHASKSLLGEDYASNYDKAHFGEAPDCDEFRFETKLRRCGQIIGYVPTPDFTMSSARGDPLNNLIYKQLQSELRYDPISDQDNVQDTMIGTQENKNQYNGRHLPMNLTRLVKWLRVQKGKQIWEHACKALEPAPIAPAPQPAPAPEAVPQPEGPAPVPEPAPQPEAPAPAPEPAPQPEAPAPVPEPAPQPEAPAPAPEPVPQPEAPAPAPEPAPQPEAPAPVPEPAPQPEAPAPAPEPVPQPEAPAPAPEPVPQPQVPALPSSPLTLPRPTLLDLCDCFELLKQQYSDVTELPEHLISLFELMKTITEST